ncbi:hypothetical protein L1N85_25070 [Paenibacillus alkaliterrae]|nr:hypothetical protein [Paenibacillus alkaliterrae]
MEKVPYMLVLGENETAFGVPSGNVAKETLGLKNVEEEFIDQISKEIREKK